MKRSSVLSATCVAVFLCTLALFFYGSDDAQILESGMEVTTETTVTLEIANVTSSSDPQAHKSTASGGGSDAAESEDKALSPTPNGPARCQSDGQVSKGKATAGEAVHKEPSLRIWEDVDPEVSICRRASDKDGDWFRHCRVPNLFSARRRIDAYVTQRMENYKGKCTNQALQFHCLEFAARMRWCNWDLAASPQPPPPSALLNPKTCNALLTRQSVSSSNGDSDYKDDHKLVFFYPSYAHLEMLNRSISALQHPNHVFLIQVESAPYANENFVKGVLKIASDAGNNNICVMQYGRILYTTASQILILLPAMAWVEQMPGWTHMAVVGPQVYPIVSTEKLRRVSWEERANMIYTRSPAYTANEWRRDTEILPYCYGYQWEGHTWGEVGTAVGSWVDDTGRNHPDPHTNGTFGGLRFNNSGFGRVDWLSMNLDKKYTLIFQGGQVAFITRDIAKFLLHDSRAKMWIQYFSYMMIACEHLLPSITYFYFPHNVSERITCFMAWSPGWIENRALNMSDWDDMVGSALFARKLRLPESEKLLGEIDRRLRVTGKEPRRPWHQLTDEELRRRALRMAEGAGAPKIAFLFLVTDLLPLARVWERYFTGHEEKYSIYVHALPGKRPGQGSAVFRGRLVPGQWWKRGEFSMVAAEVRLLLNALLDDPANQRFILMTETTIPTRPFPHLFKLLIEDSPQKSFQEITLNGWARSRLSAAVRALNITPEQFGQGSEYFCLTREDAIVVGGEEEMRKAFFLCGSSEEDNRYDCHPEEHYIPTILALKNPQSVEHRSLVMSQFTRKERMNDTELESEIFEKIRNQGDHVMFAAGFQPHHERSILGMREETLGY